MKKYIFLLLVVIGSGKVFAQHEGTFYFMNTISQSTYYNPAFTPKYNTTIGLPGLASNYFGIYNSGFAFRDLISRRVEDDSLIVTLDQFYNKLKDKNHIKGEVMVDLFHLSFKLNPRMHFTLNVTDKNKVHLVYPKEIANLLINGNVPYIGENTNFSMSVNGLGYIESGLGLNYSINPFWTVGVRFKLLNGYGNIMTEKADFTINTAENYQIELVGDALLRSAGADILDDGIDGFSDFQKQLSTGYGIDLGISFKPVDRLTLGLSLVDLGSIKWVHSLKSLSLDPAQANYTFRGIDIAKIVDQDSDFEFELDSLSEKFELMETLGVSYRSVLPQKIYLSCSYELGRNLYTNLLLSGEKRKGALDMYATANMTKNLGKAMTLSLSYTAAQNSYNNWGAGVSFNLAPFQLYFVGDSMLGAATSSVFNKELNPYINGLQYFNFRFGLNFIGAWQKSTEKLSDDKLF